MFPPTRQFLAAILLLLACLSCRGVAQAGEKPDSSDRKQYVSDLDVVVLSVAPLPYSEWTGDKRWKVEMKVLTVIKSTEKIDVGQELSVRVHSIARDFRQSVNGVIGQKFRVNLEKPISKAYFGNVEIAPWKKRETEP